MNTTAEGTEEDTTADMGITADMEITVDMGITEDMAVTEVMGITVDTIKDTAAVDITIITLTKYITNSYTDGDVSILP